VAANKDRSLRILSEKDGVAIVRVIDGKVSDDYRVERIPADFGKGFSITKVVGEVGPSSDAKHQVCIGNDGVDSCSCPGHVYRGHCRHIAAIKVLIQRGFI
jgi:hypothetical protein